MINPYLVSFAPEVCSSTDTVNTVVSGLVVIVYKSVKCLHVRTVGMNMHSSKSSRLSFSCLLRYDEYNAIGVDDGGHVVHVPGEVRMRNTFTKTLTSE